MCIQLTNTYCVPAPCELIVLVIQGRTRHKKSWPHEYLIVSVTVEVYTRRLTAKKGQPASLNKDLGGLPGGGTRYWSGVKGQQHELACTQMFTAMLFIRAEKMETI